MSKHRQLKPGTLTCAAVIISTAMYSNLAHAGLMVNSIDMEVRNSSFNYQGGYSITQLQNEFYQGGSEICSISLENIDRVGSRQSCDGPGRNFATLISIDLVSGGDTKIQFGPDWGRGGVFFTDSHSEDFTGDRWWAYQWNNPAVIEVDINEGARTVNFLGWEGCCAGGNSARFSTDGGESWDLFSVDATVSEPAAISLFGLGIALLARGRNEKSKRA